MLQCVAVWCSALHSVSLCCNALQYVAVCSYVSVLQCAAVCCSMLQCDKRCFCSPGSYPNEHCVYETESQTLQLTCVGDTDTRRSHTGYILMMNGGPISWKSRRQDNVSLATSEAEFVAANLAGQEAIYLHETLTDFGFSHTKATLLYEDNFACDLI